MGKRKRLAAEKRRAELKNQIRAVLRNCPSSPRKMRLVADLIRGKRVDEAQNILSFTPKHAARVLSKLLKSAINNYLQKTQNQGNPSDLYVKTIYVDGAGMLKRILPAPQGRAYRIRKRSNHVTIILDTIKQTEKEEQTQN